MKCDKCKNKMVYQGQVDEHWKFYKCPECGYEKATTPPHK